MHFPSVTSKNNLNLHFTLDIIRKIINKLDSNKAHSHYMISIRMLIVKL